MAQPNWRLIFSASAKGRAQPHGYIVGEVISANWNHGGVNDDSLVKDDDIGRTGPNVADADAQFAFVGAQHGIGTCQHFVDRVVHADASAIHHGDDVLNSAGGGGDHMYADLELTAQHSRRIAQAFLLIENEILRQKVQDVAIFGQWKAPRLVDRLTDIFAGNLARLHPKRNAALAVSGADMRSGNPYDRALDRRLGRQLSLVHRLLHAIGGLIEIDDDPLARAARSDNSVSAIAQAGVGDLDDQRHRLGGADVDDGQDVLVLLPHKPNADLCGVDHWRLPGRRQSAWAPAARLVRWRAVVAGDPGLRIT